jgi:hypothetical protein
METNGKNTAHEFAAEEFCRQLSEEFRKLAAEDGTITLKDCKTGEENEIPLSRFVEMFGLDDLRVKLDPPPSDILNN